MTGAPAPGILTVTLNPAKDVVYVVDRYRLGEQHRSTAEVQVPGGKGNNVAKTIRTLGGSPVATGIVAGTVGDFIERGLAARGVRPAFTRADGESRTCFSVLDGTTGELTEIYPPRGASITPAHLAAFESSFVVLAATAAWVVIAGSLPAGVPRDYPARLVELAGRANVVVDGGPAELAAALPARPFGVKCNAAEAAGLLGAAVDDLSAAVRATAALAERGARLACITRGPAEVVLRLGDDVVIGKPPLIEAVSAVGSGDALMGGLVLGLARGEPIETALRWGLAAGAANALQVGAGELAREVWAALWPGAEVGRYAGGEVVARGRG